MQKYKKPIFSYSLLGVNPCRSGLSVPVGYLEFKDSFQQDGGGDWLHAKQQVDKSPSCRLYTYSQNRKVVSKLSSCGKELFVWIMYELEAGKEALWINRERYFEENGVSVNTYKKSVDELVRSAIIAYTVVKDVYWINPAFFFSGDRIKMYPDCLDEVK